MSETLFSKSELVQLLKEDKAFRDAFALEFVKTSIPSQLRALRKEREWTQDDLGRESNKPRNVITRLENPNSHIPNLATMYEVAVGCKAALFVKIIPFSELLREYDKPFATNYAPAIDSASEATALEEWIHRVDEIEDSEGDQITKGAKLTLVSDNPNRSANQRSLSLTPLKLITNTATFHQVDESQLLAKTG